MIISDKHHSIAHGDDIRTVCKPLFACTDINFFIYCRFYDDGSLISFPSNTAWHKHFMQKEYFSNKMRMQEGLHLWAAHKQYSQATIDAREYFNIDNKFEIVERGKNYYDVYGFAAAKDKNSIVDYYINNVDYLKKFGLYFRDNLKKIITNAKKPANRLDIRYQLIDADKTDGIYYTDEFMRNQIKRYYINTRNTEDIYLTNREIQILLYTLQQRSAADIGRILLLSPKTVEAYLANVKAKLGCASRSELFDRSLEGGVLQLIASNKTAPKR